MNSKKIFKKILVIGFGRTGTHLIKSIYYDYYNIKKKLLSNNKLFYSGIRKGDIFIFKNNKFFIYTPWEKKIYSPISKKKILNLKILSTHEFNSKLFDLFKEYKIIVSIRSPVDTINSIVNYVTKENIFKNSKNYKIKNKFVLVKKFNLIQKYIERYKNFYDQVYRLKLKNLILLDYKDIVTKIYKIENIKKKFKIKKSKLHSNYKNKKIRSFLLKNYNFKETNKIYKKTKIKFL